MRYVRIWAAMLCVLTVAAACADAPTAPVANARGSGPSKYTLEPVIVIGHPQDPGCNPYTDLNFCQGSGGTCMTSIDPGTTDPELVYLSSCYGGGGGTSAPGGGGTPGGGSPGTPGGGSIGNCDPATDSDCENPLNDGICTAAENGTVCEGEDRPECQRRPDASGECVTRTPNPTEWAELGQKVDRMTENTDYCRQAKAIARGMYSAGREGGRIVLWNGRNYRPGTNQQEMVWGKNSSDSRGRIIEMDSYLASAVPSLLAHEALHAYLSSINWQGTVKQQEDWVGARETECAG